MGFTHYHPVSRSFTAPEWARITVEVKSILAAAKAKGITVCGGDGKGKPIVNEDIISLNGDAKVGHDHETFYIPREHSDHYLFCKTARKPYDEVVVSILATVREIAPDAIEVSSDGGPEAIKRTL